MSIVGTTEMIGSAMKAETKRIEDYHLRQAALKAAFDLIPETAKEAVADARIIEAYLRGEADQS